MLLKSGISKAKCTQSPIPLNPLGHFRYIFLNRGVRLIPSNGGEKLVEIIQHPPIRLGGLKCAKLRGLEYFFVVGLQF